MAKYILGIDQSTQGTKALLFDGDGKLVARADLPHRQIVNELGWVEHDPEEIYRNTIQVVRNLVEKAGIDRSEIVSLGISNQRESALVWDRMTGKPLYNVIVWQCARGQQICERIAQNGCEAMIRERSGLQLSPYFSAAKIAWVLENVKDAKRLNEEGRLACGTVDSWLVYRLTGGKQFATDFSNASRTQLFNIRTLSWDSDLCNAFGVNQACLAEVRDSNGDFGETDFEGFLDAPIPIRGVLGDSHGALFGQGCLEKGMIKATYGTGSSIMMNIGEEPVFSDQGIVTSLAWSVNGKVNYVLEGNINYTGAVITWLKDDLKLISGASETEALAKSANPADQTYLVPAFTGLGAPYWDSNATAIISGITRKTGRAELVRAALDCIAYQITDIVTAMREASNAKITELRVDGGPTKNKYLMQFQSDLLGITVRIPDTEELSGLGAAYVAGLATGVYTWDVFERMKRTSFIPEMDETMRTEKYEGWKKAVEQVLPK
ncbi:MAG: glycerol kinase GlpK [Clostridiales bacterium]|nr:glycerol kinase GlpK [Clostridiales bacterium]